MQRRRVLGDAELAEPAGRDVQLTHRLAATREERSEEHTSELQSQSNLVCRLLLEKKKQSALRCRHRQNENGRLRGDRPAAPLSPPHPPAHLTALPPPPFLLPPDAHVRATTPVVHP